MDDLVFCVPFEFFSLVCVFPQRGEVLERAIRMMVRADASRDKRRCTTTENIRE
jgi:hypothetical protein